MTKNNVIVEAAATKKGQHLVAEAIASSGLAGTDSFVVRHYEEGVATDFSLEKATEIMCAFFWCIANTPKNGVDAIDSDDEPLWQVNWVRDGEPRRAATFARMMGNDYGSQ